MDNPETMDFWDTEILLQHEIRYALPSSVEMLVLDGKLKELDMKRK
jgi:hypothetical protein